MISTDDSFESVVTCPNVGCNEISSEIELHRANCHYELLPCPLALSEDCNICGLKNERTNVLSFRKDLNLHTTMSSQSVTSHYPSFDEQLSVILNLELTVKRLRTENALNISVIENLRTLLNDRADEMMFLYYCPYAHTRPDAGVLRGWYSKLPKDQYKLTEQLRDCKAAAGELWTTHHIAYDFILPGPTTTMKVSR